MVADRDRIFSQGVRQTFLEFGCALLDWRLEGVVAGDERSFSVGRQLVDVAVLKVAAGESEGSRRLVDEDRGLHELAAIVPLKASPSPKIQKRSLETLFVDDTLFKVFELVHPWLLEAMIAGRHYQSASTYTASLPADRIDEI